MNELREFTCKYCQHTIAVNPELPQDYMPTVCTSCYDRIVKPRLEQMEYKMGLLARKFCELIGVPIGPSLTDEEEKLVEGWKRQFLEVEKNKKECTHRK